MLKWLCILYPPGDITMRRIHKLFLVGCGYAILILTLFYAYAAISDFISPAIAPGQFALILASGLIISLAEFMYEELKLKKMLKCIIHYCVLLVSFCLIFIISGKISTKRPAAVFIAIMLYTLLYFLIFAIVHFSRKAINKMDDKLESKKASKDKKAKKSYTSLYSDGE